LRPEAYFPPGQALVWVPARLVSTIAATFAAWSRDLVMDSMILQQCSSAGRKTISPTGSQSYAMPPKLRLVLWIYSRRTTRPAETPVRGHRIAPKRLLQQQLLHLHLLQLLHFLHLQLLQLLQLLEQPGRICGDWNIPGQILAGGPERLTLCDGRSRWCGQASWYPVSP
jgi:hypothetical protein